MALICKGSFLIVSYVYNVRKSKPPSVSTISSVHCINRPSKEISSTDEFLPFESYTRTMDPLFPCPVNDCISCRHIISRSDESYAKTLMSELNAQEKSPSSFLIIPALETIVFPQLQKQQHKKPNELQEDNEPSTSTSSSSSSSASAREVGVVEASQSQSPSLEQVSIVKCTSCDKSIALLINGQCIRIEAFLRDETKPNGWRQVETGRDRIVLFILNQIIYREYEVPDEDELQVEYALPPETDLSKILWINGTAVGFYSVKRKGTLDLDAMECYSMTVLDTLFIRNSYRRKGYALAAIHDLLEEFPEQNIGFSVPISLAMIKVLKKHLELHPADRMKLWEVTGCGSEGNCQILWFLLHKS